MAHAAILLLVIVFSAFCASSAIDSQTFDYESYCHDILSDDAPQPPTSSKPILGFHRGFFHGGSPLFNGNYSGFSLSRGRSNPFFSPASITPTDQSDKYLVEGAMILSPPFWSYNRTRVFRRRSPPRSDRFSQPGTNLKVKGVWVGRSSTLCMAGCLQNGQTLDCNVKITFYYPSQTSITQPLVKGKLESQRNSTDPLFFDTIFVTAVPNRSYNFTKEGEFGSLCASTKEDVPANINVWKDQAVPCSFPWHRQVMDVVWDSQCTSQDCDPFGGTDGASQMTLSIENLVCKKEMLHGFFVFSLLKQGYDGIHNKILAVEGKWDLTTGKLCMSACYLRGANNDSLTPESPDCDLIVTLQFPTTFDLLFRYNVVGHVERRQKSASLKQFSFRGHMDVSDGMFSSRISSPRLVYAYTSETIKQALSKCPADSTENRKKGHQKAEYPDGHIFSDLGFYATLKKSLGGDTQIYFSPISINNRTNRFYNTIESGIRIISEEERNNNMNISFDINIIQIGNKSIKLVQNTSSSHLSAEGVYNPRTGMLCLIACRTIKFSVHSAELLDGLDKDCQIFVKAQYPLKKPGYFGKHGMSGEILSLRDSNDSLYFESIDFSSDLHVYRDQARQSVIQIDLEVIMVIISLTMAALFVGLQLRHVKRHPVVLASMSLLMLTVLILGHLIPLILNFEAIFSSRLRQNVLQWSGGWLEINEVVVRLMTMVVFLLLLRLLHLAWTSKATMSGAEGPWHMERSVLYVCLTTYVLGGLIAVIVYASTHGGLLQGMKAYAGLAVDFFLFPQVVRNYVWDIQGTVLSLPFYFGMTLVRSLPHLYDTIRKLNFVPHQSNLYYYANPSWDFYSNVWDAVIPCGTLLLVALTFLQQRYGGSCLLPRGWRQRTPYEKISANA